MNINEKTRKALLRFQQNEITESLLYAQLAAIEKDPSNKEVLLQIANDEKGHYTILKKYTGQEISPNKLRITKYYWLARILGITFAIKLMEGSEESAKNDYASYDEYPDLQQIARDEDEHEQRLIALINEERLEYMGSVVLGLNDALVEFTGEQIIPVEVKAEVNLRAKSLKTYQEKFSPDISVRTSMADFKKEDWLINLPLYAIEKIDKTIDELS